MNVRAFVVILAAACDPVRSDAVAALGGEAPGVPHGPTHRPGQPCLLGHSNFAVAGTVFTDVGRNGACASCHFDPAGRDSPGHVFAPADGVTP